jgi:signal transduction histidine kinase
MKSIILYILIFTIGFFGHVSVNANNYIDSMNNVYAELEEPEEQLDVVLQIVQYCIDNYDKRSLDYITLADSIVEANDLEKERARLDLKYGYFWRRFGSRDLSVNKLNEAMELFEKQNDRYNIGRVHRQLGETFRVLNKDSAIYHLDKAYKIFVELKDTFLIAKTLNRFAAVYYEMKQKKKSIKYTKESLDLLRNIEDDGYILNCYILMIANYRDLKQFEIAELYVDSAKARNAVYPDKSYTPFLYLNIAMMQLRQEKYSDVVNTIDECFRLCDSYDLPVGYNSNFHNFLAEAYLNLGEHEKSVKQMMKSKRFTDSVYKLRTEKDILQEQMKGEAEKVRQELEYQEALSNLQLIIFFGALLIVGLIIYIILKRNKDMRRINAIISEKNDELLSKNDELHDLNATKDKFFSIIAHDLKNPIGSFRNITQVLSKEYHEFTEEDKIEFIDSLRDSSKNLYNLLENLLTWSRSQRGVIECNPDKQNLAMVIQNTLDHLTAQAMAKNIQLENNIPFELEAVVDANLTSTVVRNLVSNSIKYSDEKSKIEVNSISNGEMATIEIRDYGVGMDEETCKNIFRIDNSKSTLGTKGEKGTGLGLIVCKEFIDKQGGDIWVESKPGEGSSFYFTVKLAINNQI